MFLKKEVILLGVLLSLRIIFTIVQILIDYKILSGQYSVNFMDIFYGYFRSIYLSNTHFNHLHSNKI